MNVSRAFLQVSFLFVVIMALIGATLVFGLFTAIEQFSEPALAVVSGPSPELDASSWVVYDAVSGEILFENNIDEVLPIASVTKLLVAALIYDQKNLEATTTITWVDLNTEGEAGRFSYGDVYTIRELLFPLLLESSNDAASTLTRIDPTLIEQLNNRALQLHLKNTRFNDASGLSDGNLSTAREVKELSQYVYKNFPHILDISRLPAYYSQDNGWLNNSPFGEDSTYRGGKHGFTYTANRTVTAFFEESINGKKIEIGYVILGSDDLRKDMKILREHSHNNLLFR